MLSGEKTDATTEGDSADSDGTVVAEPHGESMLAEGTRQLTGGQPGLGPNGALFRVDMYPLHRRQIEDDPTVGAPVAGDAVAPTADSQLGSGITGNGHHVRDLVGVGGTDDHIRLAIDAVVHRPRFVVRIIFWCDHLTVEDLAQLGDRQLRCGDGWVLHGYSSQRREWTAVGVTPSIQTAIRARINREMSQVIGQRAYSLSDRRCRCPILGCT